MTATTASISELLKNQYEGPIREQLNLEAMIYDLFEEGPHQWAGASVHIPLHTRGVLTTGTAGIHYGSEGVSGAVVPQASNQEYLEMVVGYQSLYAAFEVTGQAESQAPGNGGSEAAFIGAMYSEMRALEKDIRHKLDRDMFIGRGLSGFAIDQDQHLAAGTGNTVMISGANSLAAIVAENTLAGLNTYVKVLNVPRDAGTAWAYLPDGNAAPTASALFQVGAIDQALGVAILDSTTHAGDGPDTRGVAVTDVAVLVEHDVAGNRVRTDEVHGLNALAFEAEPAGMFTNSRLALLNTVLRGFGFKGAVGTAVAGESMGDDLDIEDMQLIVDGIEDLAAEKVDCLIMHRYTRAKYKNLFQQLAQWLPGETNAKGGFTASELSFDGGVPIKVSSQAPYGVIYYIRKDTINTYTLRPGGFQEFNDSGDIVTQKRDQATARMMDVREGFWKQYFELVSEKPRCIGVQAGVRYKRA